jgi:hypothetical protein
MLLHHAKYYDGQTRELKQYSGPHRGFGQVAYEHHAKYNDGRIQKLKQYSGPHRGFSQDTHASESDSESDHGGVILQQLPPAAINNAMHHPNLIQNDQKTSTTHYFAHASQETQREDTQALRGSRPSGRGCTGEFPTRKSKKTLFGSTYATKNWASGPC